MEAEDGLDERREFGGERGGADERLGDAPSQEVLPHRLPDRRFDVARLVGPALQLAPVVLEEHVAQARDHGQLRGADQGDVLEQGGQVVGGGEVAGAPFTSEPITA